MNNKFIIGYTCWCGLGFIRGVKSYNYNYNKYKKDEPYMYLNLVCNGLFGIFIYANPILLPVTTHKEFYRLETNLRNLEKNKNNDFYKDLI